MTEQNSGVDKGRRGALKKITAGVGVLAGCALLPERWVTPVIECIVLPAHPETSGTTSPTPPPPVTPALTACTVEMTSGDQSTNNISFAVDGVVSPPAAGIPINVAFDTTGVVASGSFDIVTIADGTYSIGIGPTGGPGYLSVNITVTSTVASGTSTCSVAVPPAP